MIDRRLAFLEALRTWPVFGRGWASRVAQVKQMGQAWATGSVGPQPAFFLGGNAKATIDQAKPLPAKGPADATTGAGVSLRHARRRDRGSASAARSARGLIHRHRLCRHRARRHRRAADRRRLCLSLVRRPQGGAPGVVA